MTTEAAMRYFDAVIDEPEMDGVPAQVLREQTPTLSRFDCDCGAELEVGKPCAVCGGPAPFHVPDFTDLEQEVAYLVKRARRFGPWRAYPVLPVSDPQSWAFDIYHHKLCWEPPRLWMPHAYLSAATGLVCVNTHGEATEAVRDLYEGVGLVWNPKWWRFEMDLRESEQAYPLHDALEVSGAELSRELLGRMVEVVS
jgi:hypothetical protein